MMGFKCTLLCAFVLVLKLNAQSTFTVIESPDPLTYIAISNASAPNGNSVHATFNGIFFVDSNDLTGIPSTSLNISSFGFAYTSTLLSTPANGTLTVYLANTNDVLYSKGNSWTVAIAGMTQVYSGILNIPTGTIETVVDLNLPIHFNYNGPALYVAFSYTGATFDNTSSAYNKCTYQPPLPTYSLGMIADSQMYPDLNNMYHCLARPVFRFGLANPTVHIKEFNWKETVVIYPNPCSDQLTIHSGTKLIDMILRDVFGKIITHQISSNEDHALKLNGIDAGVYFLELRTEESKMVRKIIINK